MGDQPYAGPAGHRLARYLFIESLLKRKRVLEVGCAGGEGLGLLLERGASQVVGVAEDADEAAAARAYLEELSPRPRAGQAARWMVHHGRFDALPGEPNGFDLVLVPEVEPLAERPDFLTALLGALKPDGVLMVAARNPARRPLEGLQAGEAPGVDYGALAALLGEHFPRVRMIGQSPFLGTTLVDFEPQGDGELELELDSSLCGEESEDVSYFMALASHRPLKLKGYSLVQVPYWATLEQAIDDEAGGEAEEGASPAGTLASDRLDESAAAVAEVAHLRGALATAQHALDDTAARAQEREARLAEVTAELQNRDWRINELEGMTRLREGRLRDLEERLAEAEAAGPTLGADAAAEAIAAERVAQDLRVKLQAREAAAAELRLSLDEWMSRGTEAEKVRAQLEARTQLVDGELRARVAQVRDLESERSALLARAAELEGTLAVRQSRVAELERSLTDRSRRLGQLTEQASAPAAPLPSAAQLQEADDQRRALQTRIDALTAQLSAREDRIAELTRIIGDKDQFIARRVDEHESMVRRLSAAEVERKQAQQDAKEYEGKLKTRDLQIKQLENANRDTGLQLRQLQRAQQEAQAQTATAPAAPAAAAPLATDGGAGRAEVAALRERLEQADRRASALAAACDRARDELREVLLREAAAGQAAAPAAPAVPIDVQELQARARTVDDLLRAAEQHATQARELERRIAELEACVAELEQERRGHQDQTDRERAQTARAEALATQAEQELRRLRQQHAETEGRLRNLQLSAASGGAGELAEAAWKDRVEQLERELALRNRQRAELEQSLKQERHRAEDAIQAAARSAGTVTPVVTEPGSRGGAPEEPPFGTARARAEAPAVIPVGAADVHSLPEAALAELRRLQQGDNERREELRLLRREVRERDGERDRLEGEIARRQDELLLVQRELVAYGERLQRSEDEAGRLRHQLEQARQELESTSDALDGERKVRTQDGNRVVELARERERRDAEIARLGQEHTTLRGQKDRLQGELASVQTELTESRRAQQRCEQRAEELGQTVSRLESELEQSRERERKMGNELDDRKDRIKQLKRNLEAEEKRGEQEPPGQAELRARVQELEAQLAEARAASGREQRELEGRHKSASEATDKRIADLEAELNWRLHEGRAREAAATEAFREREETIFRLENRVAELEGDLHRRSRELDALKRAHDTQQAAAAAPSEPGGGDTDAETVRLKKRIAELEGEIVWRGHEYQARDQAQTEALKTRDKEIERLSSRVAQLEAARAGQAHGRPGLGGAEPAERPASGGRGAHDAQVAEAHAREELLRREIERTQDKMRRLAEELSDKDAELLALFSEVEGQRRIAQRVSSGMERLRRRLEENAGDVEAARLADELRGLLGGGESPEARPEDRP